MSRTISGRRRYAYLVLALLLAYTAGCVHVPKESAMLSGELARMIVSAKEAHLAMIDEYMDERRRRVDRFIDRQWSPAFISTFVEDSKILSDLDAAGTAEEKGALMLEFAEAATERIYRKRTELTDALDEVESILKGKVEAHYDDMLTVNQALTAHLRSAAEVASTRDELLGQLRVEPEKIIPMDELNGIVGNILTFEGKARELAGIVAEVRALMEDGGE